MIQFIQLFGAFHDTIYSIVLNLELIYSSFPGRNKIFFVIYLILVFTELKYANKIFCFFW